MPVVTATPRGMSNGQVLREFTDSVGTSSVTYTYPTTQEGLTVRNVGTKAITVTVAGSTQAIQPGQKWEKTGDFTSFNIVSASGVQAFEAVADEKGDSFNSPEGRVVTANAANIALKADKTYVDTLVSGVNASPKGVHATVTDLQTAFPTGNTNIYLVTADGKWYFWNGSAWTAGGVYQATSLADNSVTEMKLADTAVSPKLNTVNSPLRYKAKNLIRPVFEVGSLSTSTGLNITDVGCLRTNSFITVVAGENVNVYLKDKENYVWAYFKYQNDGTYVSNNAYTRNDLHLDPGFKYRILVRKSPISSAVSVAGEIDSISSYLMITYGEKPYYLSPESLPWYHAPAVGAFGTGNTVSAIYDMYDALVTSYPFDVTKTLLGNDSTGLPIYSYTFSGSEVKQNASYSAFDARAIPKVLLVTNIHGDEKASTYALANLMTQIYTNWASDPLLEFLRFNVQFVVVPILNPYGFNNNTRRNANDVDLNRNFDYRWSPSADTFKGSAAFSELESQYIQTLIQNNPDAMCFIDFHANGSSGSVWTETLWFNLNQITAENRVLNPVGRYILSKMTRQSQTSYGVPSNSGTIGKITYDNDTPLMAAWVAKQGIPSMLVECGIKLPSEAQSYTTTLHQMNLEYFANLVVTVLNQFKNI